MSIEVKGITKKFGSFTALNDIHLKVGTGELIALLGPSGSGKTTLLRVISGLETPDAGQVHFHDEDSTAKSARERGVGFVFQHYALFRHMTVFENVAFGMRVKPKHERPSEEQIKKRVHELLSLIQLDWVANRLPSQLSGGQRQRIALARALAVEPKVLLLDEPFGSLDAKVRKELRQWLRRFHDDLNITSLFVTHDQEEALEVADRVVIMHQGKIEQVGTPAEVYHNPANAFVLDFLGNVNLFHCRVEDGKAFIGSTEIDLPQAKSIGPTNAAKLYVRPNQFTMSRRSGPNAIEGVVRHVNPAGSLVKIELAVPGGGILLVEIAQDEYDGLRLKKGETAFATPKKVLYTDYSI